MKFNKNKIIPFIEFNITDKCNYNCEYCVQEERVEKEKEHLSLNASDEVINNFIEIVKNIEGHWKIKLLGGEALIHPRFFELADIIVSSGQDLHITTNFSFPIETYKKLMDICGERLTGLCASLHLSQIKSPDDFINKAIEFNNYKSIKTNFTVLSVLTEENFETLKNLQEKFNKYNIKLSFQRLKIHRELINYNKKIEDYLNINPEHAAKEVDMLKNKNMFGTICHAGYKAATIQVNGNVSRCYTPQIYLGHLGKLSKKNIHMLNKPMPCLSKECKCSDSFLKHNLIELNHKNYLKAFYFYFLGKSNILSKIKRTSDHIKKNLHSIKLFIFRDIK